MTDCALNSQTGGINKKSSEETSKLKVNEKRGSNKGQHDDEQDDEQDEEWLVEDIPVWERKRDSAEWR